MWNRLAGLQADLRAVWRGVCRAPGPVVVCVAVLSTGLGGTTAAFSALYEAALRPLPYPHAEQIVAVHSQFPRLHMDRLGVSPLDYLDLTAHRNLFRDAGVFFYLDLSRTGLEHAQKVNAVAATTSLFKALQVKPAIGRLFSTSEERTGGPHAVVISNEYWRTEFAGDLHVLERAIWLNGEPYPVVGVMPRSFSFPNDVTQMWVPVVFKPQWLGHLARQNVFLHMYGRLAAGVTFGEAVHRLEEISRKAAAANRGDYTVDLAGWSYFLVPLAKENNASLQSWAWILFWSVIVLFGIVCVNVLSLLAMRATQRSFEISVRLALGAGVLQGGLQSVIEGGAVCLAGGVAGWLVAAASIRLLNLSNQFGQVRLSLPVFLFGLSLTIAAATVCSGYLLWKTARTDSADALKSGGHQRTRSAASHQTRRLVMVFQIAASTLLLAVGGLLLDSYVHVLQTPLGFEAGGVMTMQISLPPLRYATDESRSRFYEAVVDRINKLPGVKEAGACTVLPFGYGENVQPFSLPSDRSGVPEQLAVINSVLPGFFGTLQIPLLAGRYFNHADLPGHEAAVIVDENMTRRYFPGGDALQKRIVMGKHRFLIVGVVRNIRVSGLDSEELPMLYLNATQMPSSDMSLVVRSSGALDRIPQQVQGIVTGLDRDQPVYDVARLEQRVDKSIATRRFVAMLLASFAALGMLVVSIGLYGTLTYAVILRGQEFGIRSALGAGPRDLALLIVRQGMGLAGAGALLGTLGALGCSRYIAAELYGVSLEDPVTWFGMAGVLITTTAVACAVPSWRASRSNAAALLKQA